MPDGTRAEAWSCGALNATLPDYAIGMRAIPGGRADILPAAQEGIVSDFEDLKKRVEAAGRQFGMMSRQRRDYGQRLIDMVAMHERNLAQVDARMAALRAEAEQARALAEQRGTALQAVQGENEQLRHMLHSLLQAIESGRSNDFEETMHELDRRISAMVQGGEPQPVPHAPAPPSPRVQFPPEAHATPEPRAVMPVQAWPSADPPAQAGEEDDWGGDDSLPAQAEDTAGPLEADDWEEEPAPLQGRRPSLEEVLQTVDAAVADAVDPDAVDPAPDTVEAEAAPLEQVMGFPADREGLQLKGAPISAIADSIAAENLDVEDGLDLSAPRSGAVPDSAYSARDDSDPEAAQDDERPFELLEEDALPVVGPADTAGPPGIDRLFDAEEYEDEDPAPVAIAEAPADPAWRAAGEDEDTEFDLSDLELGGEIDDGQMPEDRKAASAEEARVDEAGLEEAGVEEAGIEEVGAGETAGWAGEEAGLAPSRARRSPPRDSALAELDALLADADMAFEADADVAPPSDLVAGTGIRREGGLYGAERERGGADSPLGRAPALRDDLDEATREEILARVRERHSGRSPQRDE